MKSTISSAGLSVVGRLRKHNEDNLLCQPDIGLWLIADGMGGHKRGDLASSIAAQSIHQYVVGKGSLIDGIIQANTDIALSAEGDSTRQGMGTTVVALKMTGFNFEIAWVGDSRAYLIDKKGIQQISRDHSWVQEMLDAGELTQQQALTHPHKNVITRCLGHGNDGVDIDQIDGILQGGQTLLLCSDGLTGELTDEEIFQHCCHPSIEINVECLIDAANEHGGRDNISCILVSRDSEERGIKYWLSRLIGKHQQE